MDYPNNPHLSINVKKMKTADEEPKFANTNPKASDLVYGSCALCYHNNNKVP